MVRQRNRKKIKRYQPESELTFIASYSWRVLIESIQQLLSKRTTERNSKELNRLAYLMVIHDFGGVLYDAIVSGLRTHLDRKRDSIMFFKEEEDSVFLDVFNTEWKFYKESIAKMEYIFSHLDCVYLPTTATSSTGDLAKPSIGDLGFTMWGKHITQHMLIKNKLQDIIILQANRARITNASLPKTTIEILLGIGSDFHKLFGEAFLDCTAKFYREISKELIKQCSCSDYLSKAENYIVEEKLMLQLFLSERAVSRLIGVVEVEMLGNHLNKLVHTGLVEMIENRNAASLETMFRTAKELTTKGLSTISNVITRYVNEKGEMLLIDLNMTEDPVKLVQIIIDEIDKYEQILLMSPPIHQKDLTQALVSTLEYIFSKREGFERFIALFMDGELQKGWHEYDIEFHELQNKVVNIFRCLQDQAVFEKYHRELLIERISSQKFNLACEELFIRKLKNECGYVYTRKLERILSDMQKSGEVNRNFQASQSPAPAIDVCILGTNVCKKFANTSSNCCLPPKAKIMFDMFEEYYKARHTHRSLTIQANMGTAVMAATFGKKKNTYELHVSTYQMFILSMFNSENRFTFKTIQEETKIPANDLITNLQSLVDSNILLKEPMNDNNDGEDDYFVYNHKFTSKLHRIDIVANLAASHSRTKEEVTRQGPKEDSIEDRNHKIDAAITRIMKKKKILNHKKLVKEVRGALESHFVPGASEVKRRIEHLIDKEYVRRDKDNMNKYIYLP